MPNKEIIKDPLSWSELSRLIPKESNRIEGPTNSYALLRLFGQPKTNVRITLYRDNHAWCPYCQKVWLWLEWKQIPYKIKKVTMRCYGKKESWYLKKVPSGMLPALELDNQLITESDQILIALENTFGPLGSSLKKPKVLELRILERKLFRAWCIWLCQPALTAAQEKKRKDIFQSVAREMENNIQISNTPWLDPIFDDSGNSLPGSADVIFIPYLERMNASLAYYKGLNLREEHPMINQWFNALEALEVYRGTQGDFHTHAHDLPPQMGGCWFNANSMQKQFSEAVDCGEGLNEMESHFSKQQQPQNQKPEAIALLRVFKHRHNLIEVNPLKGTLFDQPLRASLTRMLLGQPCAPNKGSALGLRYLRDRISVPRDMPLLAARELRQALEETAKLDSAKQGPSLETRNRFDQDPEPFSKETSNSIEYS